MKGNDRQAKKSLSVAELEAELRQTREKAFRAEFKHTVTPLKNPMELKNLRRHIARLSTWINEKRSAATSSKEN
ncbi:MAG: 50S ribosomal protein L29 [Elusimicrobia bacterium]|nr:50S ribosomal protein L29 [Elusimicrobiota bacterium]